MKILISLFFVLLLSSATTAQSSAAVDLANKMADKMRDTLQLSVSQRAQIFQTNIKLNNKKTLVRNHFQTRDSIGIHIQRIENTRDSLYKPELTVSQFSLYMQKRKVLINNN